MVASVASDRESFLLVTVCLIAAKKIHKENTKNNNIKCKRKGGKKLICVVKKIMSAIQRNKVGSSDSNNN